MSTTDSDLLLALYAASDALHKANIAARELGYTEIADDTRLCSFAVTDCIGKLVVSRAKQNKAAAE